MSRSILIIGTLDTKGDQIEYLKQLIERREQHVMVMDVSVMGNAPFQPDIGNHQVAEASGSTIEELRTLSLPMDPKPAMDRMALGAAKVAQDFCNQDKVCGVLTLGGSMGTALAIDVMKSMPIGIPKMIVSTIAHSAAITPDMVGGTDIMMLPWTGGLWGLNDISKRALQMAAGAVSGAAEEYGQRETIKKKIVGATSLGGTACHYMHHLKPALEERGYQVAVFHVTGMSGRMFEAVINGGLISASLDLSAGVELLHGVAGGAFSPGAHRLEAAGKLGIPQIVSTGAVEFFHWGNDKELPASFKDQLAMWHNKLLAQVLSSPEQCAGVGQRMAQQINKAKGPTAVILPMKSLGMEPPPGLEIEASGIPFPKGESLMKALRDALLADIGTHVDVIELDAGFNEPVFSETVLDLFDKMMSLA